MHVVFHSCVFSILFDIFSLGILYLNEQTAKISQLCTEDPDLVKPRNTLAQITSS